MSVAGLRRTTRVVLFYCHQMSDRDEMMRQEMELSISQIIFVGSYKNGKDTFDHVKNGRIIEIIELYLNQ